MDTRYKDEAYTQRLEKIEAVLHAWLPEHPDPAGTERQWMSQTFGCLERTLTQDVVQELTRPGWDLCSRGGKRWRPLLMSLVCEALGGGERALALSPLVELPHTASLIHDDIEDHADERRGEPAIHIRYGTDRAINSGSFLYFQALACMSAWDVPAERKSQVLTLWGTSMRRLHLGQAMDIGWHRDFSSLPSLEAYDRMCRLKTGSLARLAAVLGVLAAFSEDSPSEQEALLVKAWGKAGEQVGVGFQILDDVKNLTTGNPGKKRGDDVVEGKKSLPVLLYLCRHADHREWVSRCFAAARRGGSSAPEVEALIHALTAAGVLNEAAQQGRSLINAAREVFSRIPGTSQAQAGCGALLGGLLDFIGGSSFHDRDA
jgi:octaprenyl-diphosphate synthase